MSKLDQAVKSALIASGELKSASTQGPWFADKDNWIRDAADKPFIFVDPNWRSKDEVFAIRNLIATAPDLLALIERAQELAVEFGEFNEWLTDADALIAKARGSAE